MKKSLFALAITLVLSSCAFTPDKLLNVFAAKQSLDSVAAMVVDCVEGTPTEQKVAVSFNYLIDLKEATKDMKPDAEAVKAILGGKATIARAGEAWKTVKSQIIADGLECSPALGPAAATVEKSYDDLVEAIEADERIVTALEWGSLLAGMVGGPSGAVVAKLAVATVNQ